MTYFRRKNLKRKYYHIYTRCALSVWRSSSGQLSHVTHGRSVSTLGESEWSLTCGGRCVLTSQCAHEVNIWSRSQSGRATISL